MHSRVPQKTVFEVNKYVSKQQQQSQVTQFCSVFVFFLFFFFCSDTRTHTKQLIKIRFMFNVRQQTTGLVVVSATASSSNVR